MAGLRKCKECGRLFLPKGREHYCSEDHYRPCPICGAPVIVKWFNDPPRKCDACKWRKIKPLPKELAQHSKSLFNFIPEDGTSGEGIKQELEILGEMTAPDNKKETSWLDRVDTNIQDRMDTAAFCHQVTGETRIYVGPELKHMKAPFVQGHEYLLKVEKHDQVYWVIGEEDCTTGKDVHIVVPYTSQLSINQNFARMKESVMRG